MKAVNLIPGDQRRGAGGVAGRAGGVVYVLVGGLAVLVVMSVLYAVSAGQVSSRQSKLTAVSAEAGAVQSQASQLQPYVIFASIRQTREQSIASLAASRFDWAGAMDQIARALPNDVTLSALTGTPTPSGPAVSTAPASGPSVALTGCATTHSEVANVLVDLHRIVGVTGVSLATSTKAAAAASAAAGCSGATFTASLVYGPTMAAAAPTTTTTPQGVTASTAAPSTTGSTR